MERRRFRAGALIYLIRRVSDFSTTVSLLQARRLKGLAILMVLGWIQPSIASPDSQESQTIPLSATPTITTPKLQHFPSQGLSIPIIASSSAYFTDTRGYWATACIEGLATQQLLQGDGDGLFRPNGTMTRAEFAAVMIQTFPNAEKVRSAPNFVDVAPDYWAKDVITQAYEKGFLTGYPGNIFRPTQPINRAQAITVLANTQGLAGAAENPSVLGYFEDRDQIPGYAERAIAAATLSNFIVNYPVVTQLRPQANLVRGEAAAFLCQVISQADPSRLKPRYAVPLQYIAQADAHVDISLPANLQAQLTGAMAELMGGTAGEFAIASAAPVRWRSCIELPCQPQNYEGFRVKVSGQGQTFTYYTTTLDQDPPNGSNVNDRSSAPTVLIQLDGPASLSPLIQANLKRFNNIAPAGELFILAAQPVPAQPNCSGTAPCKPFHWQVLTNVLRQPFYQIDLQGQNLEQRDFSAAIPAESAGLADDYVAAVLRDVQRRTIEEPSQALPVTSIRAIRWNDCQSGEEPRPSQPSGGICQDRERSGWQLSTPSGELNWIHYFPAPLSSQQLQFIRPDGLQSLPQSVKDAVIEAATRYDRNNSLSEDPANPNQYRVQWATAQFFDACLQANPNAVGQALLCSQAMQSGWRVEVIGNQLTSSGGQALLTYHSNLDGSQIRFNAKRTWLPPL